MSVLKVGLVQQTCSEDRAANVARSIAGIRDAAARGANLIVLQELHTGTYFCQSESDARFDQAETIPGPSTAEFGAIARELSVVIVISLFEKRAPGLYHNTAVVLEKNGEIAGTYRKMHIPDDPLYFEKYYFTPGDTGFKAWQTKFGRIGVLVCWDQWYPEGARLTALDGAEILFYPTAIGWHEHERDTHGDAQHDAWETIQRSHAIANGVYVCGINRIGREGTVTFFGQSYIADPFGRLLYRASVENEEVIVRDLDLSAIEETRRNWPFLRDRRIDAYGDITKRFRS